MASLTRDKSGLCKVQVMIPTGERNARGKPIKARRKITLGKMSRDDAVSIKRHIEHLASALTTGQPIRPGTADWLADVGDELHSRLAKAGLCEPRAAAERATLGAFTRAYIVGRKDAKPNTVRNMERARTQLVGYFGSDRQLSSITPGDADAWYQHLVGQGYAPATIGRDVKRARQFYTAAMRRGLADSNPFKDVKAPSTTNRERDYYVTPETAQQVIDAAPDAQWRLIIALSRFGGLRCPSEVLALTWQDVNWERGRVKIRSCKTEHHDGGGSRIIPLFPELRPYLEDAQELAEPGASYCITRYRDTNSNLRTQLLRIIDKAGVDDWAKPFHNMRASRETELAQRFPLHVVCSWLGNSTMIATKHYLQVTDDHFTQALQQGAESGAKSGALRGQNRVQPVEAASCHSDENATQPVTGEPFRPNVADDGLYCTNIQVPRAGVELPQETPGKTALQPAEGAKSGALFQAGGCEDADLQRVVDVWPTLPDRVKAGILRAVQSAAADMVD